MDRRAADRAAARPLPTRRRLPPLAACASSWADAGCCWPPAAAGNLKPRNGKKDYSGHEYHCLVRATDGDRKLSTVVQVGAGCLARNGCGALAALPSWPS